MISSWQPIGSYSFHVGGPPIRCRPLLHSIWFSLATQASAAPIDLGGAPGPLHHMSKWRHAGGASGTHQMAQPDVCLEEPRVEIRPDARKQQWALNIVPAWESIKRSCGAC